MPKLTLDQVKERLPHREPILLVDEVLDYVPGKTLSAVRHFPLKDRVFDGHFEGHPILPGMLTVESIAQAAGLLVNLTLDKKADETLFYFMGVDSVRFRQPVRPGDTLRLEVEQLHQRGDVYKYTGIAYLDDKPAVQATFTAKLILKDAT